MTDAVSAAAAAACILKDFVGLVSSTSHSRYTCMDSCSFPFCSCV